MSDYSNSQSGSNEIPIEAIDEQTQITNNNEKELTRAVIMAFVRIYIELFESTTTPTNNRQAQSSCQSVLLTNSQPSTPPHSQTVVGQSQSSSSSSSPPPQQQQQQIQITQSSLLNHSTSAFTPLVVGETIPPILPPTPPAVTVSLDPHYFTSLRSICLTLHSNHQNDLNDLQRFIGSSTSQSTTPEGWLLPENAIAFDNAAFRRVMDVVFSSQKSWGRIIMLLAFTAMLTMRTSAVLSSSSTAATTTIDNELYARQYVDWATNYVHDNLWPWIQEHGGWEGLLTYEWSGSLGAIAATSGQLIMFGGILMLSGLVVYFLAKGRQ